MSEDRSLSNAESFNQAMASTPPAIVSGLVIANVSLQDWVMIATLGWLSMQMGWFIYRRVKELINGNPTE